MDLSAIAAAAKADPPAPDTFTAVVVRSDESGLWVSPLGDDVRHPVGPCRGGYTAQGTLAPPGALVVLIYTPDGPWAVGLDNPALAVSDASLAPFANPSFEITYPGGGFAGWSDFWSAGERAATPAIPPAFNKYVRTIEEGTAAHGLRSLRVDFNNTRAVNESGSWSVPAGASIEVSFYARADGVGTPYVRAVLFSNTASVYPGPFSGGTAQNFVMQVQPGIDWLRYRAVVTIPATHTEVNLFIDTGNDTAITPGIGTIWLDNIDADLVEVDPAAANQDYIRRARATLAGGGLRQVTPGGNVSWSQPLTIAAAGMAAAVAPDGRFEITMPANGTVIPVHSSTARSSHTVAGGVIALNTDDALWYELPIGDVAASQPARFHIIGSTSADGYVVPPHWLLVVRRGVWSSTNHAPEYVWGDGRQHDPWRTPSLNVGWIEGTVVPRFAKTGDGRVMMRGRVRSGAGSAFTLPNAGYFPVTPWRDIVPDGLGAAALITITTAGVVTTSGNNTDHSIETTFPIEQ